MKIPLPKLKALLLYFCENTEPKYLGKVKLLKLVYFLDFLHVKRFASPVTYDRYVKLDHGPMPSTIKNLLDDLHLDGKNSMLSDVLRMEYSSGEAIHRIVPKRKMTDAEKGLFNENEMRILQEICQRFGNANTLAIENASHAEAAWRNSATCEEIPYETATHDADCLVKKEDIAANLKSAGL